VFLCTAPIIHTSRRGNVKDSAGNVRPQHASAADKFDHHRT